MNDFTNGAPPVASSERRLPGSPGASLLLGLVAGAASWGLVALVSDQFEPFDSTVGFYLGQALLCATAVWLTWSRPIWLLAIYLLAAYVGMNLYAYIFGGGDQRAWFALGLVTTLSLVILPLVAGMIAYFVAVGLRQYRKTRS